MLLISLSARVLANDTPPNFHQSEDGTKAKRTTKCAFDFWGFSSQVSTPPWAINSVSFQVEQSNRNDRINLGSGFGGCESRIPAVDKVIERRLLRAQGLRVATVGLCVLGPDENRLMQRNMPCPCR